MSTNAFRANRATRRDRNRRRRAHTLVNTSQIRSLCKGQGVTPWAVKAAYHVLAEHSDLYAERVYGHQKTFAEKLECSVRHFQRCIRVLQLAGLVRVMRCAPERMPDGRIARQLTNRYFFTVPKASPNRKKPSSHRDDSAVAYKPQPTVVIDKTLRGFNQTVPIRKPFIAASGLTDEERTGAVPRERAKPLIDSLRSVLRAG